MRIYKTLKTNIKEFFRVQKLCFSKKIKSVFDCGSLAQSATAKSDNRKVVSLIPTLVISRCCVREKENLSSYLNYIGLVSKWIRAQEDNCEFTVFCFINDRLIAFFFEKNIKDVNKSKKE